MLDTTASQPAPTASGPIAVAGPAVVKSQREFLAAIRERIGQLNVSLESVNEMCSLPPRYANKLLSPSPIKRLGVGSLWQLARGLGMELQLVENPEATRQIRAETVPRRLKLTKPTSFAVHQDLTFRFMRKIGRKGGAASRAYMTRREATELGRRAARARWAKAAKATKPTYLGRNHGG
jgi:hypothetical protein